MIEFLTGFVAGGAILYVAYLAIYVRKKATANDIEVERLKSNVPETIYPWHDAPDWAVCAVTDRNRRAYWEVGSVQLSSQFDEWVLFDEKAEWKFLIIKNFTLPPHINWKDSKEMRP